MHAHPSSVEGMSQQFKAGTFLLKLQQWCLPGSAELSKCSESKFGFSNNS